MPHVSREPCAEHGFSLIDLLVVLALASILAGMTVVAIQAALVSARGDAAMIQVTSALRYAREAAITQRRSVDVVFVDPDEIQILRNDVPEGQTVLQTVRLDAGAVFALDGGIPDTPDAFGIAAAIDFGDADTIRFVPDGMFTDEAGLPVNGTIFLARPGEPASSRAITVTGGSGRAQGYRWMGSSWEAK